MVAGAHREIALRAYSYYGLWTRLPELSEPLRAKAESGCRVRVTIGDPDSPMTRRLEEVDPEPLTRASAIEFSRQKLAPLVEVVEVPAVRWHLRRPGRPARRGRVGGRPAGLGVARRG
jgi:hypothetical protein